MTLSIIIVSWNVKPLLERCLKSIFEHGKGLNLEIIVVDNNSKDGSQEFLRILSQKKNNLHIILNNANLGFAKANNLGIVQAQGEYILLLNPDTEILDGALQKTVKFLEQNDDCGIIGCQLVGIDGKIQPSVRNFPTVLSHALIFLKLHLVFPQLKIFRDYFLYDFDYAKRDEVDQAMGAFLMTKRSVIKEIGLLDENFYLWFEEVDFCKRIKDGGWKIIYYPEAKVLHHGSQSFRQILPVSRQRIYNKSAIYYFQKYCPCYAWYLILLSPISLFLSAVIQICPFLENWRDKHGARYTRSRNGLV